MLESKEVTRLVPKIMKKKWSDDDDSNGTEYIVNQITKRPQDGPSDENVNEDIDDNEQFWLTLGSCMLLGSCGIILALPEKGVKIERNIRE